VFKRIKAFSSADRALSVANGWPEEMPNVVSRMLEGQEAKIRSGQPFVKLQLGHGFGSLHISAVLVDDEEDGAS
jgi:hypothetical protein